jgi:Cu-Zn family superoxide dismutase
MAFLASCTARPPGQAEAQAPHKRQIGPVKSAIAEMYPARRTDVHGLVHLRTTDQGLLLRGNIIGLKAGLYGLGIHQGDCSSFDGKSAGGYFAGTAPGAGGEPIGRLDDLLIEHPGDTNFQRLEAKLSLTGPDSVVGRALVVHAWPFDPKVDVKTVPFAACGVIQPE